MKQLTHDKILTSFVAALTLCVLLALAGCTGTSGASSSSDTTSDSAASSQASSIPSGQSSGSASAPNSSQPPEPPDGSMSGPAPSGSPSGPAPSGNPGSSGSSAVTIEDGASPASVAAGETVENSADGEHAIQVGNTQASYSNITVVKTGEASGDEADFYGSNSAIYAANGATLDLNDITVNTNGTHANAVFSYGTGTTINVSDSTIETTGNCSGGLMTTGGGTMNATNLTVHTTGRSSAPIRSDRGGGTVVVNGGSFMSEGLGSPTIYSTADITVNGATLESTTSEGAVVEGRNSITLNDVTLTVNNNAKNSSNSDNYEAIMIYQSMSGDAEEGEASFAITGGTLTNKNGDIFFVNNTTARITLDHATITNEDTDGVFLRAAAAGWGRSGSNGGHVKMTAIAQAIDGDLVVDDISSLALSLTQGSQLAGAINADNASQDVTVTIDATSTWTLTGDSYVTSLECSGTIELAGHSLYVNGVLYSA